MRQANKANTNAQIRHGSGKTTLKAQAKYSQLLTTLTKAKFDFSFGWLIAAE